MKRTTIALVAAVIFMAPASALAECAWVLWLEQSSWGRDMRDDHRWEIVETHYARNGCMVNLKDRLTKLADHVKKRQAAGSVEVPQRVTVTDDTVSKQFFERGTTSVPTAGINSRFRCLPDTVDPRGPKGK